VLNPRRIAFLEAAQLQTSRGNFFDSQSWEKNATSDSSTVGINVNERLWVGENELTIAAAPALDAVFLLPNQLSHGVRQVYSLAV
jgi:hypothetical protein